MQPKVIFLGSAGGHEAIGKQIRASGGILIETEGLKFLIDPGPGCLVKAREYGINLREISAIFLSHNHPGHANDLNVVVEAMTLNGMDKQGVIVLPEEIVDELSEYHLNLVERVIKMQPGKKLGINDVEITGTNAEHNVPAMGFKIASTDFTLSYLGDTKYSKQLIEDHKGSDILVCNCKNPFGEKEKFNLNSEDISKLAAKIKPRLLVLTHFGMKLLKKDPLFEAREIQKRVMVQTIAAKDGMIINPSSHAARVRQRSLNAFRDKEELATQSEKIEDEQIEQNEELNNETKQEEEESDSQQDTLQ